jgi:DNA-binding PadR family transcriptional regulator
MMPVIETTRPGRVAAHRAAARLNDLGLIDYRKKIRDDRRVYVALTPLGVEVVDRYRRELTKGQRIRWPREEG